MVHTQLFFLSSHLITRIKNAQRYLRLAARGALLHYAFGALCGWCVLLFISFWHLEVLRASILCHATSRNTADYN
jgi:hypothetical protein